MLKAYLEKCDREWFDDFVYAARQPLSDRGFDVVSFRGEFLSSDTFETMGASVNDVVVGSVEATVAFWKSVGIEVPGYIGYPEQLYPYLGRRIEKMKLGDIPIKELPVFIKPATSVKMFTGTVVDSPGSVHMLKQFTEGLTDDTELYVSESIDMLSEYRCFVHKGALVGIKHYLGDFKLFPDMSLVEKMIAEWIDSPVAYTLDVAITADGSTILVEVNDFWAIGGYGLDGRTYVRMLVDRFQEIKGASKII
jgi:hypothetical protein